MNYFNFKVNILVKQVFITKKREYIMGCCCGPFTDGSLSKGNADLTDLEIEQMRRLMVSVVQ